jgi:hypothetical protein
MIYKSTPSPYDKGIRTGEIYMAKSKGSFAPLGQALADPNKRSPRTSGKPGETYATRAAREAIAEFVDLNSTKLQRWLDEIYDQDGPKAAFGAFSDLLEYHVPKLARTEVVGKDEGPIEIAVSWSLEK